MKALQEVLEPTIIDIWSSLFSLDAVAEPGADLTVTYVGCVHLAGEVSGTIVVQCDASLARLVAARMFDVAQDEASEDDIRDAIGEIANIAAGNLKAALSTRTTVSLPMVVHGSDFGTHVPNSQLVASRTFSCGADRFSVSVYEHVPPTGG